jgi:hypothetical protein
MLKKNPEERITISEAMGHKWVTNYDIDPLYQSLDMNQGNTAFIENWDLIKGISNLIKSKVA